MRGVFQPDNFSFYRVHFDKYHYTDNRRGSPMNYIARMLKGTAQIVSKHGNIKINEGDIFFIPVNLPYQSYWYGDDEDEIEFLSYGFLNIEAKEKLNYNLQVVDCDDAFKNLISKIPTEGSSLSCETLSTFYGTLSRLIPYLKQNQPISKKDELVKRAKKYITSHTDCSVAEVAQSCYISEPYLYMLFKENVGCTPNDYRLKAKCKKGIEYLLTTDKTVEEISSLIGFSSASHFRRVLKSHMGLTPKEVRKGSDF